MNVNNIYSICKEPAAAPLLGGAAGTHSTRVKLKGFIEDSKFFVYAMEKSKWTIVNFFKWFHAKVWGYVSLNDQVYVKVDSLSRRLLLPKKYIKEAAGRGEKALHDLIEERAVLCNPKVNLTKIAQSQIRGLSVNTLRKVTHLAVKYFKENDTVERKVDGHRFLFTKFSKDEDGYKVVHLVSRIGGGTFGNVHCAYSMTDHRVYAYKEAEVNPDAIESLVKETKMLKLLSEKAVDNEYFQTAPISLVQVRGTQGYFSNLYDGNLEAWLKTNPTNEQRIACCKHLLKGFKKLFKDLHIRYTDIKPQNILYKKEEFNLKVHFADFGETEELPKDAVPENFSTGLFTPNYTCRADLERLEAAWEKKDVEEFTKIEEKRAIFALGCTFYQILTGDSSPFTGYSKNGHPHPVNLLDGLRHKPLTDRGYQVNVNILLQRMLYPDYTVRPSIDVCIRDLDAATKPN